VNRLSCIAVAAAGVALVGCSSGVSVTSDYDPGAVGVMEQYETYSWMALAQGDDPRVDDDLLERRIKEIANEVLVKQGFREVSGEVPDFLIGYHAAVQGGMDGIQVNSYYGYGWGGWYGGVYGNNYVRYYEKGALIIDIVDAAHREIVYRGTAEAEVDRTMSQEARDSRLRSAIEKMLRKFPPQ